MSKPPTVTSSPSVAALRSLRPRQLRELLRAGHPIALGDLHDSMYRGVSLGIPHWVESLAWTTFMKTFQADQSRGVLRGWNVRLEQTGLDGPVRPLRDRGGDLKTFGHYEVVSPRDPVDGPGLLIDYGQGRNGWGDPAGLLRDPIVALRPGGRDRLLGWTYVRLGAAIPTPSFFLLERLGALDHDVAPPR